MALKKQSFSEDEITIFDEAIIYKRGDYWHFRMWLAGEVLISTENCPGKAGFFHRDLTHVRTSSPRVERGAME